MTDRELLELAAKAAGFVEIDFLSQDHWANVYDADGRQSAWNPLTNDGDALRLAVKLRLMVDVLGSRHFACWGAVNGQIQRANEVSEDVAAGMDEFAATRRAIVRAAAEIGKAMP